MTKESINQTRPSFLDRARGWVRENARALGAGLALGTVALTGVLTANAESANSGCDPQSEVCTPGTTVPGQEGTSTTEFSDKGTTSSSTSSTEVVITSTTAAPTTTAPPETTVPGPTTTVPGTTSTIVTSGPQTPTPTESPKIPEAAPTS